MVVVVEPVPAKVSDVQVGPSVVVVVPHRDPETPALIRDTGSVRDIREGAIVIVVQQHRPWSRLATLQGRKRRAVHKIDIEPPIPVIVEERNTGAGCFQDRALFRSSRLMVKLVYPGCMTDVLKNSGSPAHEPTRRNRAGLGILDGSVRSPGAHAGLLSLRWVLEVLLRKNDV